MQFQKRYSQGLVLNSFYTFSKALDDCDTDYGTCTGVDAVTNRNLNKGRAGYDMRHRFVTSATYELPVGKGRRYMNRGGILNMIFGGYEIAWIQTVETGNPIGFSFANSPNNYYPDQHRQLGSQSGGHADHAAFGLGEADRRQSLQPGAGEPAGRYQQLRRSAGVHASATRDAIS